MTKDIPCPHTDSCVELKNWKEERWDGEKKEWIRYYCCTPRSADCDLRHRQTGMKVNDLEFTWFNCGLVRIRRAILDLGFTLRNEHYSQGEMGYSFVGNLEKHTFIVNIQVKEEGQ